MTTFLPKEVQDGLDAARARDLARKSRYRVSMDGQTHKILKLSENGFSVDAETAPHLRGLVDIFDGTRQLYQCLIVASLEENGQMWYDYKRSTVASDKAPLDFYREPNTPVGYLTDER
jgi:hypothetical protein